jgi:transcriptional regulator with GAF, ATPase, and Fis domain
METNRFSIVKNLPIPQGLPSAAQGRSSIYPFREMEMGDCLKFEAESTSDTRYRKIYNSARSHARRTGCQYEFRFAQLDERTFGCWKVERSESGQGSRERRRRRTAVEINSIPLRNITEALHNEGTVAGAARRVGISPRTLMRLMDRFGIKQQ